MDKPKIIIVDTNVNYIIPLQLKFIEEFFNKIDLEIISDTKFFEEFCLKPQKADILIISQELYNSNLQRHNINNIFVMTEQYEEDTDDLNINKLFKYTSVKEIFNEVISKSKSVNGFESQIINEPRIVLIYSASGGTGKTTLALGMSSCLTKNYKRVLYLNADNLQSFSHLLKNTSSISNSEVYANLNQSSNNAYAVLKPSLRKEIFNYIPPFKSALMSIGLDYSIYEKIAIGAKKSDDYDFIIIDADKTFDEDKARLINIADKVIIVTNQTVNSVVATNNLVSNINRAASDKYIYICNEFCEEEDNALISPNIDMKFSITDYIKKLNYYDRINCDDISKEPGVQRIALLVL